MQKRNGEAAHSWENKKDLNELWMMLK